MFLMLLFVFSSVVLVDANKKHEKKEGTKNSHPPHLNFFSYIIFALILISIIFRLEQRAHQQKQKKENRNHSINK